MPFFSIIMPAFRSSKYIGDAVESVLSSAFRNWELIIVDDASDDDTAAIAERYTAIDSRISLIKLKNNAGASHARNTAIDYSSGQFIVFLDSDDELPQDSLSVRYERIIASGCDLLFTGYDQRNLNGKMKQIRPVGQALGIHCCPWSPVASGLDLYLHSVTASRACIGNLRFDEGLVVSEDRQFIYSLFMRNVVACVDSSSCYLYKLNSRSLTHNISSTVLIDSLRVDREIYDSDCKLGNYKVALNQYVSRLLAAKRFIFKNRDRYESLSELDRRLNELKPLSKEFTEWVRLKFILADRFPFLYRMISVLFTKNSVVSDK